MRRELAAALDDRDPLGWTGNDGDDAAAAQLDRAERRDGDDLGRQEPARKRRTASDEQGQDRAHCRILS